MGRTKADSIELDDDVKPADSHVARTVVEVDGVEHDIFRRNTPYGSAASHGTMFVGFSHEQGLLHRMLLRMAGVEDGIRDALTRYTTPAHRRVLRRAARGRPRAPRAVGGLTGAPYSAPWTRVDHRAASRWWGRRSRASSAGCGRCGARVASTGPRGWC